MQLLQCSSNMDATGVSAASERPDWMPQVRTFQVLVRRSKWYGFGFFGSLQTRMQNCAALHCGEQGLVVLGYIGGHANWTHTVRDCLFRGNAKQGVRATHCAELTMKNVLTCYNKGCGVLAALEGTTVQLTQCYSTGNSVPFKSDGQALLEQSQSYPDVPPSETSMDDIRKVKVEPKWSKESRLIMSFMTGTIKKSQLNKFSSQ